MRILQLFCLCGLSIVIAGCGEDHFGKSLEKVALRDGTVELRFANCRLDGDADYENLERILTQEIVSRISLRKSFVDEGVCDTLVSAASLQVLEFSDCTITQPCIGKLGTLWQLKKLKLVECGVPDRQLAQIAAELPPNCEIIPRPQSEL